MFQIGIPIDQKTISPPKPGGINDQMTVEVYFRIKRR
jgi:hypothetical protein